jgi:hypothetical protein
MTKDLPFRDDPAQANSQLPVATRPWEKMVQKIKGMLVGVEYEYAGGTLRGILASVERTRIVTDGQERAVGNIADNPSRDGSAGRRSQRWYGG